MPRYGRYNRYDDPGFDRAWDNYYNQCHCEYFPAQEEYDEQEYIVECDYCRRERAAADLREAKRKAEEARLRATGWYTEITTMRSYINRFAWLTAPGYFDARVALFREMFTTLAGYEKFLAAQPKFRATVVGKLAECRAHPRGSELLKDSIDALEAVLARLPTVEGYKE